MYVSDHLPFAVLAADRGLQVTYANNAAEVLFQKKFTALRGQALTALLALPESMTRHLKECLEHGVVMKAYDQELVIAGRRLKVNIHLAPVWHSIPGATHTEGITLTIDLLEGADWVDRQRAQQDLSRQIALMSAMLAHEIKNPLSSIRSAAQLLESETGNELTHLIVKEADRIKATLQSVEFLNQGTEEHKESVNIHEVLRYVRSVVDPALTKNITIQEKFDPALPEIAANRALLIQLFLNLMKNAAEALQNTALPTITLSTGINHAFSLRVDGKKRLTLQITMEDNGPGIPLELQPNLFRPLVSTKKGGRGLGLMIAAKIAADHHGLLELAKSAPGGTVFRVLLPTS